MERIHGPLQFGRLDLDWRGDVVFVIAGGTSLVGFPFELLRGKGRTIGANKAALFADTDALFTLDQMFARKMNGSIRAYVERGRTAILSMPANEDRQPQIPGATYVQRIRGNGLSSDPTKTFGHNSGFGALNAAFLTGATDIRLLGFDMVAGVGQSHFHDGYDWHHAQNHRFLAKWATAFDWAARDLAEAGVEVTNYVGEPQSAITAFKTAPLASLIDEVGAGLY